MVDDKGTVANITTVNSSVETKGWNSDAGIGGGVVEGTVANTTAMNSTVETKGEYSDVGIGGGAVHGTVANTMAVNSHVTTSGSGAHAAIGVGHVNNKGQLNSTETVVNTTAVNSHVIQKKSDVTSNGQLLCQKADQRVLTANCSLRSEFLDAWDFSYSDVCPVNAATPSTPPSTSTTATPSTPPSTSTDATAATASTAAAAAGITMGTLVAAGGLGIVVYTTYQWITGYQAGLRGQELVMKPLNRGKELASAAVNSVSQGIRERLNRQRVPTQSSV